MILPLLGIAVVCLLGYVASERRAHISYTQLAKALMLQVVLALITLKTTVGVTVLRSISGVVEALYVAADKGSTFVFGALATPQAPWGFIFAFRVLPIIVFFGALMNLLFYLGIIQRVVNLVGRVLSPFLGIGPAEGLCAIANSFLGQTEAPLLIRHYIGRMTRSELFVVMVSGMGTLSGGILAVYGALGIPLNHLLAASVMAIPATIFMAKLVVPAERGVVRAAHAEAVTGGASNMLDALASGTSDGLMLALNVGAMLVAFIALIGAVNSLLGWVCLNGDYLCTLLNLGCRVPCLSLETILAWFGLPFAYLMGLTGSDAESAAQVLGLKVCVNEMIAYMTLLAQPMSDRAFIIMTYALAGFSNFSCIGIQLGGIGSLVPEKKKELASLGFKAVFAAAGANLISACIVSLLL